jgi:hypothetical protein
MLPEKASQRLGIQQVVSLTSKGTTHATVKKGQSITFRAQTEVPPNAGTVTSIVWDFEGTGDFVERDSGKARDKNDVEVTYTYRKAGTYYASVRVAVHRKGDTKSPYAQVAQPWSHASDRKVGGYGWVNRTFQDDGVSSGRRRRL